MCKPASKAGAGAAPWISLAVFLAASLVSVYLAVIVSTLMHLVAAAAVLTAAGFAVAVLMMRWLASRMQLVRRSVPQNSRNIRHIRASLPAQAAQRPRLPLPAHKRLPAAPERLAIEPAPPRILPGWTGAGEDLGDPIVEEAPALLNGAALAEKILRGVR